MAGPERYARFFAAEIWTRLYRTLPNANFAGYDFQSLRAALVEYIRRSFPEDFNDFLASSEFIAIVDVLAFLAQSLAFRTDLNIRENFIDHAERRTSLLRLARLIGYRPSRRRAAGGLVRIAAVRTNAPVVDPADGRSLANVRINWNDRRNPDWFDQMVAVLDHAFASGNRFGLPIAQGTDADGVAWQLYTVSRQAAGAPIARFDVRVAGRSRGFELVSVAADELGGWLEQEPRPDMPLNVIWRNDGQGYASPDTGFFVGIRQGRLTSRTFTVTGATEHYVLTLDAEGINETDLWLQTLDEQGDVAQSWTRVPAVHGLDVIYNDIPVEVRHVFADRTEDNDRVSLVFGDGRFGAIPEGTLRVWWRTSADDVPEIRAAELRDIDVTIPYLDAAGRSWRLTLTLAATRNLGGSAPSEDAERIRLVAPQIHYAQDRMVSGEDYAALPLRDSRIVRVRAINRTFAAHSRYTDLRDPTGTFAPLRVLGEDGILHRETVIEERTVGPLDAATPSALVSDVLVPAMESYRFANFLIGEVLRAVRFDPAISPAFALPSGGLMWDRAAEHAFGTTGRFVPIGPLPVPLSADAVRVGGSATIAGAADAIRAGALIRFRQAGWVRVVSVRDAGEGGGNGFDPDGRGKVELAVPVAEGDVVEEVLPPIRTVPGSDERAAIADRFAVGSTFALAWDPLSGAWLALSPPQTGLRRFDPESSFVWGDPERGWMVLCENLDGDPRRWRLRLRTWGVWLFSARDVEFHPPRGARRYDPELGAAVGDTVEIVEANTRPPVGRARIAPWDPAVNWQAGDIVRYEGGTWQAMVTPRPGVFDHAAWKRIDVDLPRPVRFEVRDVRVHESGAADPRAAELAFADLDGDGVPDDPDAFDLVVHGDLPPDDLREDAIVVWRITTATDGREMPEPVDDALVFRAPTLEEALAAMDAHYLSTATRALWGDGTVGVAVDDRGAAEYVEFDLDLVYTEGEVIPEGLTVGAPKVPSAQQRADPDAYEISGGRRDLRFVWRRWPVADVRLDPAPTAIVELTLLTRDQLDALRSWRADGADPAALPEPPSAERLRLDFADLEARRAIADVIVWRAARPVPLYGPAARPEHRARIAVVRGARATLSDGVLRQRVADAINRWIDPAAWEIGEPVYASEVVAAVHRELETEVASVAVVPLHAEAAYGDLQEIRLAPDEIPIAAVTADDVEIVAANTAETLRIHHPGLD